MDLQGKRRERKERTVYTVQGGPKEAPPFRDSAPKVGKRLNNGRRERFFCATLYSTNSYIHIQGVFIRSACTFHNKPNSGETRNWREIRIYKKLTQINTNFHHFSMHLKTRHRATALKCKPTL